MKIYLAKYNPDLDESTYGILSVHKTKQGAQNVIDLHKAKQFAWIVECFSEKKDQDYSMSCKDWVVEETDLQD